MFGKESPQMIQICPLKIRRRKEVKEDPNPVANGRKRRSTFSPLPTFPPTNFT
jgi:hypothetical protein